MNRPPSQAGKLARDRRWNTPAHPPGPRAAILLTAVGSLWAFAAGCSDASKTQTLKPDEFRVETAAPPPPVNRAAGKSEPAPASQQSATPAAEPAPARPAPAHQPLVTNMPETPRVVTAVGDPPKVDGGAKTGHDVLADCMVGQINGRPVFASEILDPLDGRLHAMAIAGSPGGTGNVTTVPAAQVWIKEAAQLIRRAVELRVRDELLLGEARARLTPEQKQGLIYFIQRIDQWASGQSGGSRAQAEEAIQARTGEGYDKFLQNERDKTLIRELIKDNVQPYVRVPWRKLQRYFEENQAEVNPPPFAVIRVLMVSSANADAVAKAEAVRNGTSEAFTELASSPTNEFSSIDPLTKKPVKNGLMLRALIDKPYDQLEWVGNATINAAAARLRPDETTGPVETGPFKVYIHREPDVVTPARSLEDAQLEILARLLTLKESQEQNEFFLQLLGKGSFTPVSRMTLELLVLAAQRHLSPELAAKVRDANPLGPEGPELERSPLPAVNKGPTSSPAKDAAKPAPAEPAPPAQEPK